MFAGARVLVAPLDWGLGHATRCIPVIRALLENNATVVLSAAGRPAKLLRSEFPDLEYVELPGTAIHYSAGNSQTWYMLKQFPAMMRSVQKEHALLQRILADDRIDAVISDQRFGLYSKEVPCVLITHQIFPFTPFAQGVLRLSNRRWCERFTKTWIMDHAEGPGLAGELSHGDVLPANARFIGPQSRFGERTAVVPTKRKDIVAVISGPEPQRSLFAEMVERQLAMIPGEHAMVLGIPGGGLHEKHVITCYDHLPATQLEDLLRGSRMIVSRSGYSTLMDLITIGRSALIVPTPGQHEQEYLAALHAGSGLFRVQLQDALDLAKAWDEHRSEPSLPSAQDQGPLQNALAELAQSFSHDDR